MLSPGNLLREVRLLFLHAIFVFTFYLCRLEMRWRLDRIVGGRDEDGADGYQDFMS